jgi:hypothetical protein
VELKDNTLLTIDGELSEIQANVAANANLDVMADKIKTADVSSSLSSLVYIKNADSVNLLIPENCQESKPIVTIKNTGSLKVNGNQIGLDGSSTKSKQKCWNIYDKNTSSVAQ